MKKFHVLLLFLPFLVWGQQPVDSLLQLWKDRSLPDSTRADAYYDFIYDAYYHNQPDSASTLLNELITFTQRSSYHKGTVDALKLAGYIAFRMGRYGKALEYYNSGLELARQIDYRAGAADILLRTGFIYHDNEDLITALEHYQESEKIYEAIGDIEALSSVYNEYGSIYRVRGDHKTALDYYSRAVEINLEHGDSLGVSALYTNIGNLYLDQHKYEDALKYFDKGLIIERQLDDQLGIASGLSGIGNVFLEQGNYARSLEYLEESLEISTAIDDIQGGAATLLSIAEIYLEQKNYAAAERSCLKSLELALKIGDIGNQEESCSCLYEVYKSLGNVEKALAYHEQMLMLADSIKNEETAMQLQQMEFKKQVLADSLVQAEKEMDLKMAHQEEVRIKDQNRNVAIGAGVLFLVLAVGFYSRWRYVNKSKKIIEKEKDRSENLLLNILPAEIAEELKEKGEAAARDFDMVSILFTDFKGFTEKSVKLSAAELIAEVNNCFKEFDLICEKYGIEKIKTIGDAYMAAGGLPVPSEDSVKNTVMAALEMNVFMQERILEKARTEGTTFEMRLGIHTGPVVAGIVGVKKFQYDVWGDTVNTASRMESHGETGKVNISQDTYEQIMHFPEFEFEFRGNISAKGKGEIAMWFVGLAQE